MVVDEQAQSHFVHALALGEGEGLAHEAAQALAQRVVPPLDVAGFAFALVAQAVRAGREHLGIRQPEVARVARQR